ncbi:WD repeat-containing protein 87 [Chytriomyces hyalinus]|nr:WD repeat-containing protein 87 [Chytriomyces hyalinus]
MNNEGDTDQQIPSKPPTHDDSSDEEYEALVRTKLPSIIPWRVLKRKFGRVNVPGMDPNEISETRKRNMASIAMAPTIPYGFQITRTVYHPKPCLKSVLFASATQMDCFVSLDPQQVHVLRGHGRPVVLDCQVKGKTTAFTAVSRWLFIPKWKLTVISTLQLELKLLSMSFEQMNSVSSVQPVLSLQFREDTDELIAGGVGNIRIWTFDKSGSAVTGFKSTRLVINDLQAGQWVTHLCHDKAFNRIFASVDDSIMVYSYQTGKRLETFSNCHGSSISCLCFYQPLQYLISASNDGIVKVWTQQYRIILELHVETSSSVTGLVIPSSAEESKNQQPLPLLLVSYMDGFIRLWNLESGTCLYALETDQDCLGISWMRKDTFLSYSQEKISIWNLNRFFTTFSDSGSQVTHLKRIEAGNSYPARILMAMEDRSMKLISPVTGSTLFTAFPNMVETVIVAIEHDIASATIWMLSGSGDISVYTTQSNPARIVDEWKTKPGFEKPICLCALRKKPNSLSDPEHGAVYALLGGTEAGQIVLIPVNILNGAQEVIIQAHASKLISIASYTETMKVVSLGSEGLIKIWSMSISTAPATRDGTKVVGGKKAASLISLTLDQTISLSPTTSGAAIDFTMSLRCNTLAVSTSSNVMLMFDVRGHSAVEKTRHPSDEDHSKRITSVAVLEVFNIFASGSEDGIVKIWDGYSNSLLREVQFGSSVSSLCFANKRGDLLVGLSDQVALIKVQDFFPSFIHAELVARALEIPDDEIEKPLFFDENLDFWSLYRETILKSGKNLSRWHLSEDKPLDFGDEAQNEDVSKELELLEKTYVEAQVQKQTKLVESWKRQLRHKRKMEKLAASNREKANAGAGQSPNRQRQSFSLDNPAEKESDDFDSNDSLESDDLLDVIPKLIASDMNSFNYDEGMSLEDNINDHQKRMSNVTSYARRQQQTVDKMLVDDEFHIHKHAKPQVRDEKEQIVPGQRKRTESEPTTLQERLDRRKTTLVNKPVLFTVNQDPTHAAKTHLMKGIKHGVSFVTDLGEEIEETSEPELPVKELTDIQETTEVPSTNLIEPPHPTAVIAPAVAKPKETKPKKVTHPVTSQSQGINILSKPARETLRQPKQADATGKKSRLLPAGIPLPNSVAAAPAPNPRFSVRHRTSSTHEAVEGADEQGDAVEHPAQPEKDFKLPGYLRSRRKREEEEAAAKEIKKAEAARACFEADLEEDTEEDDIKPVEVVKKVQGEERKISPVPIMAVHVEPEEVKAVIVVPSVTTKPEEEVIEPSAPPEIPEPRQESPPHPIQPPPEAIPEIILEPQQDLEEQIITKLETSRQPSVYIEKRIPSPAVTRKSHPPAAFETPVAPQKKVPPKKRVPLVPLSARSGNSNRSVAVPASVQSIPRSPKHNESEERSSTNSRESTGEDFSGHHFEPDAQTKVMYQRAWSLLEIAQENSSTAVPEVVEGENVLQTASTEKSSKEALLEEVTTKDWFPGLGGKEVNLPNIFAVITKVMHHGYWREKCEASKAMLYLYHTFEKDLPNAFQDVILPQLDLLNDERWEVRGQLATNLAAYRINHPEIMLALISRLNDKSEAVRRAVKNALATFGVSSKESLRNAMIELHMIPATKRTHGSDGLEAFLLRIQQIQSRRFNSRFDAIEKWRKEVRVSAAQMHRFPSVQSTLTYNPEGAVMLLTAEEKIVHDLLHQNVRNRAGLGQERASRSTSNVSLPLIPRSASLKNPDALIQGGESHVKLPILPETRNVTSSQSKPN